MKPNRVIRLLIVDDHFVVRMGLASSLNLEPDMEVVGECDTGELALTLFRQLKPDVVVMDGRLPGMDGAEATAAIRRENPEARILLLSVRDGEDDIYRAVQAGVAAYLHKASLRGDIVAAIRAVAAGDRFFPPPIAARLAARERRLPLTARELEVLRWIVGGRTNKEIAEVLGVAEVTVKLHVGNILDKLGVQDRTQATTAAIHRGIVHLD